MVNVFSVPNILTFLRIILTPVFLFLFSAGEQFLLWSVLVFTIAAVTDFADGYFARYYRITSKWGSFLDPFADKILMMTVFFMFYFSGIIQLWMVIVILGRDLFVTVLRIFMAKRSSFLHTSYLAKSKTVMQFIAIYLIFIYLIFNSWSSDQFLISLLSVIVNIFMYFVVFVTLWSGIDYLIKNKPSLKLRPINRKLLNDKKN